MLKEKHEDELTFFRLWFFNSDTYLLAFAVVLCHDKGADFTVVRPVDQAIVYYILDLTSQLV